MRGLIIFSMLCVCLSSCNSSEDKSAVNNNDENIAIVNKYRQAVESSNVQVMDSLLADNYVGFGPSISDSINKQEAIDKWKNETSQLYGSLQYAFSQNSAIKVDTGAAVGDWVSNWAFLTIKYKDGRGPVHLWVNAVYKIENKKIARSRTFYNEADVLRQLGYSFIPPQ